MVHVTPLFMKERIKPEKSPKTIDHVDIMSAEFEARRARNAGYSLRSFARDLEISPSRLSEILSRKGGVSGQMAAKLARKLKLAPQESETFLNLINSRFSKSPSSRENAKQNLAMSAADSYRTLSIEGFQLISDPRYFSVMAAMELKNFDGSPEWISQELNIQISQVREILTHLEHLDFVEASHSSKSPKYRLLEGNLTTTHDIASMALRKSHRQSLNHAMDALDEVALELRDITSITMSIDISKVKQAKEIIKKFRRELSTFLESGEKSAVYNLNIQLVPVSQVKKQKTIKGEIL